MKTLLIAAALALAAPALAEAQPAAQPAAQLDATQRDGYRAVFAAIRDGRFDEAAARLDGMGDGPLHAVARAELILAKGSPKLDGDVLSKLVAAAPDLPQAPQLAALLKRRQTDGTGELVLPTLPQPRTLLPTKGAPRRLAARSDKSDLASARLAQAIRPLVKEDRAGEMEGYLIEAEPQLGPAALTEWRQRIAWSYYLAGDDAAALRLATQAGGGSGDFAVAGDWVAGLAAWRLDQCEPAARSFARVAARARDDEMRAAGLFWAARADMACRRPELVQARLRTAARVPETFYGLLAGRALGIEPAAPVSRAAAAKAEWRPDQPHSNVQAAVALAEIGEDRLADQLIRWQARIGPPADHRQLIALAQRLGLPGAQVYLAHNTPDGVRLDATTRYPAPGWTPANGWQVDKSLVWAHSLEESVFRVSATSGAGARGLMGIMPGTADQLDRREGLPIADRAHLNDPAVNMAYGQRMLTWLRDLPSTGGLLPKVIAAYNAGPGSNIKWNPALRDRGDPLLWIESVPYIETRAYVTLVLRNYWMYQRQAGTAAPSMTALAQGMWPRFPGLAGQTATRMQTPAPAPVRLAVVMPVRQPKLDPLPDETETMLAAAEPAAVPAAAVATVSSAKLAPATAAARVPVLARAGEVGKRSLTVVKDVARTLAGPVVRSQVGPAPSLDAMLAPILKAELPRAAAGLKAAAGAVTTKAKVKE